MTRRAAAKGKIIAWHCELGRSTVAGQKILDVQTDIGIIPIRTKANGYVIEILARVGSGITPARPFGVRRSPNRCAERGSIAAFEPWLRLWWCHWRASPWVAHYCYCLLRASGFAKAVHRQGRHPPPHPQRVEQTQRQSIADTVEVARIADAAAPAAVPTELELEEAWQRRSKALMDKASITKENQIIAFDQRPPPVEGPKAALDWPVFSEVRVNDYDLSIRAGDHPLVKSDRRLRRMGPNSGGRAEHDPRCESKHRSLC